MHNTLLALHYHSEPARFLAMFVHTLFVIFVFVMICAGCNGQSRIPAGTIVEGTVSANGSPIQEATISFHFDSGAFWGTAVKNGRFSGRCPQSGPAKVCVESRMTVVPADWASAATSPLTVNIQQNDAQSVDVNLTGNGFDIGTSPESSIKRSLSIKK